MRLRARRPSTLLGAALILLLGLIALGVRQLWPGAPAQPASATAESYGSAPSYTLTDQNGETVNSSRFRGEVQVVSFLFPYCTSYCPLIARTEARLQQDEAKLGLGGKLELVSFNVDPLGSGPAQLRAFVSEFGGNTSSGTWEFLTGTPAQVHQVVTNGYHVFYQRVSLASESIEIAQQKQAGDYTPQPSEDNPVADQANVDYDIVHNDLVEVVAPDGRIIQGFSDGSTVRESELVSAVESALHAH